MVIFQSSMLVYWWLYPDTSHKKGWLWFSQLLILVFRVMYLKTIWANYNYPSRRVGHPKTWFSNGIPSKMSETFSFRNYTVDGSKILHQYGETTIIYEDFAQLRSMVYWVICPENIPSNHPTHQILPIPPPMVRHKAMIQQPIGIGALHVISDQSAPGLLCGNLRTRKHP